MDIYYLLPTFLTLHLAGLVLMAGTIVIDGRLYRTFWNQFDANREKAIDLLMSTAPLGRLSGIGAALLVLTGIGMMAVTQGVFGEQLWFRIKFALVILLIGLNLITRRRTLKLRGIIANTDTASLDAIASIRVFLNRYFFMALIIFLAILFLSVFKFN